MPIITHHNKKFCYETLGESHHPAVIYINGMSSQLLHSPWDALQTMVDKGYYVIVFDNRDVGLSQYYDHLEDVNLARALTIKQQGGDLTPPYSLQDMAEDVYDLLSALQINQAHVIGISMGGMIAQLFALAYPEATQSLCLIATTSSDVHLTPPAPEVLDFLFNAPPGLNKAMQVERHIEQHRLYAHAMDFDEEAVRALHQQGYARAYHPAGFKRQLLAVMSATPRGEALRQLQVPSLIVHGDSDPMLPIEHGEYLQSCLSNSRLVVFPHMGHGLPKRLHQKLTDVLLQSYQQCHE